MLRDFIGADHAQAVSLSFAAMENPVLSEIEVTRITILSESLQRDVIVDIYQPQSSFIDSPSKLLVLQDGQDLEKMGFKDIMAGIISRTGHPFCCVAVHAGEERKREYGIAGKVDYLGRGDKASYYTSFVFEELIPVTAKTLEHHTFSEAACAGFSLGGLTALDLVWNHPHFFKMAGVFSGSLWWRSKAQEDEDYDDDQHRIMHQVIREGEYKPGLKFYFQCGNMDEVRDRNKNGIIDSIDDTLDMIRELEVKGYQPGVDIFYNEIADGRHDVETWGRAMPQFLEIWLTK